MGSAGDPTTAATADRSPRLTRGPHPPWSHPLRGGDPSSPPVPILPPESSDRSTLAPVDGAALSSDASPPLPSDSVDHGTDGNASTSAAARGKKPAWKRPSNGSVEAAGSVMGAESWPALSESTKASPKPSSTPDSSKAQSDGSGSASPVPVISTHSPKQTSGSLNHASTLNPGSPARQKSMKRGGGSSSGAPANGGSMLLSPSLASVAAPQIRPEKQSTPEPSPRELPTRSNNSWDHGHRGGGFASQPHGGSDHHHGYGGNRRGNNGGGGSHRGGYGGRRDQERGGYEWSHRGFSGRDTHMQQQQRGVRPYLRQTPPPVSPPFMSPSPQVRPFVSPMGFHEMPSPVFYLATPPPPESFRSFPFVAQPAAPPAMLIPAIDTQRAMLLKQIDYYFSPENLCRDIYLRQKMDEQGWVPISLIAGFNRVKQLTNSVQYILDTVRLSTVVEIQGEKIRKRHDWMNWVLPSPSKDVGSASSPSSPATPNYDDLAARLQMTALEGAVDQGSIRGQTRADVVLTRSASGNIYNQLQVAGDFNGDGNGEVTGLTDSDRTMSTRSLVRSDTL